ncbi:MAG: hypothetical protein JJ977_18770 [Kordiimonadaceae bacterium]|nr:hypothetical protein [Kordiimonadaceae bacterium]
METTLSQEAIFELYYEAIAFSDTVLQIWLTVTFAAIIALYIASPNMTRFLRILIVGLYSTSAVVLVGRWFIAVSHTVYYRELLAEQGMSPFPTGGGLVLLIGPLLMVLLVVGSLATVYFLVSYKRESGA